MSWIKKIFPQKTGTEQPEQRVRRVVDNRVFLLGLDELYREAMKTHERDELLVHSRAVANALSVAPTNVPIEGYYAEDEHLTEYFRLVRALQKVSKSLESIVANLQGFIRLRQVLESPLFGRPTSGQCLFSAGEDALTLALNQTYSQWTIEVVTHKAYECAAESSDFALVTLAALARDPVVLAALRETAVLYAAVAAGAAFQAEPEYIWQVDAVIEERAERFIKTFNDLFGELLPKPVAGNAGNFWLASTKGSVLGRCVRIGVDNPMLPKRHYHWAIELDTNRKLVVKDFWDTDLWTTTRFRAEQKAKLHR
jgi:hypothetical protein